MAEQQTDQTPVPDATSDGSPNSNSATRPTIKLSTSPGSYRIASPKGMKRSMTLSVVTGRFPHLHDELMALDKNGDGQIDADELAAVVERITEKQSTIRHMRMIIAALLVLVVLIVGANFGLSFATAALSQKVKSGNGNALVDSSTGVTLRTASGQISAPYMVLDAIRDSNNVTTIRYTLPRSVGQAGCQLYSEGHFSIPASLVGPAEVYGSSSRPRTYTILEVVGCTPGGSLADNSALEATLQADMFENNVYIIFTCPANDPAANCTASQFVTVGGITLPNYSSATRRMLTASTPELLAHLRSTTGSRRAVLLAVVPGAGPQSQDHAAASTIALTPVIEVAQPSSGASGRALQGSADAAADEPVFYALPALLDDLTPSSPAEAANELGSTLVHRRGRSLLCGGSCPNCPAGQYGVYTNMTTGDYICVYCPEAFYCRGGGAVPYMCPGGVYSPSGSSQMSDCQLMNPPPRPPPNPPPRPPWAPGFPARPNKPPLSGRHLAEAPDVEDDSSTPSHTASHSMSKVTQVYPMHLSTSVVEGHGSRRLLSNPEYLCNPCPERYYALGGDKATGCPEGTFLIGKEDPSTGAVQYSCFVCFNGLYCPYSFDNTPILCRGRAVKDGVYILPNPMTGNNWRLAQWRSVASANDYAGLPGAGAKSTADCPSSAYGRKRQLGEVEEERVPLAGQDALAVYRQHIYASPSVTSHELSYYDCVICTYLWRQGLLSDDVYWGDAEFGALLKQYLPLLHAGYLTYGRKVVWVLSQVDEWYTTEVVGPAVAPWAKSMGWAVGGEGGSFSLEGALLMAAALPGTVVLGVAQAVLPVVVVELLAWAMVVWGFVLALSHWAAAASVGLGWLGLMLPQAVVQVGLRHLIKRIVGRSKPVSK